MDFDHDTPESTALNVKPYTIDSYFASRLPPLPSDNYTVLKSNILEAKRIRNPLVVWRKTGILLDGHHRDKARDELLSEGHEIEPPAIEYLDFEGEGAAVCWMLKNQEGSRPEFTTYQKVKAIREDERLWLALKDEAKARMLQGGSTNLDEGTADIRSVIAGMIGVSRGTVDNCLTILNHPGLDELKADVDAGTVTPSKAANTIKALKGKAKSTAPKTKEDHERQALAVLSNPDLAKRVETGQSTVRQASDSIRKGTIKVCETIKANLAAKVLPSYALNGLLNGIHNCDALEGMKGLAAETIDLTCTSPPYPIAFPFYRYWDYMKMFGGDYQKYLDWIAAHFAEIYRVTRNGGRFAVNIDNCFDPNSSKAGPRVRLNCFADFCDIAKRVGFHFEGEYTWYKQNAVSNRVLMGGKNFPRGQRNVEYIIVFYKGTPDSTVDEALYDLTPNQRAKYSICGWYIKPETRKRAGTAPFPIKLPIKIIKLHSVRKQVVMDPFSGSGTTCAAAAYLGRQYVGFEKDEKLVEWSTTRVAKAIEKAHAKAAQPVDPRQILDASKFRSGTKLFLAPNTYANVPGARHNYTPEEVGELITTLEAELESASETTDH